MNGPGLRSPSKRLRRIFAVNGGKSLLKLSLVVQISSKRREGLQTAGRIGVALVVCLSGSSDVAPWLRTIAVWIRKRGIPSRGQGWSKWYWSGGARCMSSKVRRAGGVLEDDALVVALAIPLRFGAIDAYWSFFTTLDATFSTRFCS
jgi:hypothetical protein